MIDAERTAAELERDRHRARLDVERVVFFSDAVFAIAITLLAIDLRLPDRATYDRPVARSTRSASLAPEIVAFALSFAVIALFWTRPLPDLPASPSGSTARLIGAQPACSWRSSRSLPVPDVGARARRRPAGAAVFYARVTYCVTALSVGVRSWVVRAPGRALSAERRRPASRDIVTTRALRGPAGLRRVDPGRDLSPNRRSRNRCGSPSIPAPVVLARRLHRGRGVADRRRTDRSRSRSARAVSAAPGSPPRSAPRRAPPRADAPRASAAARAASVAAGSDGSSVQSQFVHAAAAATAPVRSRWIGVTAMRRLTTA